MVAAKKSLALAAEAGKVKFWTTSASAGCMLYLYGASGTTYYYIHLNNDLTRGNDDRGKCVAGTAYATGLRDGAKVAAGQPVGFVGDSGDAEGAHAHLHFEVHPGGGKAVDGYPYLQTAQHTCSSRRRRAGRSRSVARRHRHEARLVDVAVEGERRPRVADGTTPDQATPAAAVECPRHRGRPVDQRLLDPQDHHPQRPDRPDGQGLDACRRPRA